MKNLTKYLVVLFVLSMVLSLSACGGEKTPETTTPETTVPETTLAPGKEFKISYDLDGGILEGNPTVYNNAEDLKLIIPIRPGYDFIGWTGTGVDTPTVSLTIPKRTEGDLEFKANWVENSEFEFKLDATTEDVLGKIFFGKSKAAIIINGEPSFEQKPSINASNELVAQALQRYVEKHKQIIKITRDVSFDPTENKNDFVFYIGISDCAPVEEFMSGLNYAQYGIAVNDDNLCYIAWTEAANAENSAIFYEIIEHVVKGGSISDFAGGRYVGMVEGTVGENVPALEGLDGGTDVGEGAYQLYSIDSTKDIYDAYLAKLESAGFKLHTTNIMNKTHCATYYSDDTVVNVVFAGGDANGVIGKDTDRSLRVVVDPLSITALPPTEKPADADAEVTVSSFTQLSPLFSGMIIQLSNGHFIVFDSGNNGGHKAISDFLRSKAPDKNNVVVEAWIFSHFHQDHIGGFVDYMGISSMIRYVTIKNVIYNFPSERTYLTASASATDMSNMRMWYERRLPTLREGGTTIYQARTGQKYYFGNAEIEILWTYEDITPFNIFEDNTNRTSIGFSLTIEGQKFMLVGDTSEEEFRVASARYGEYLKGDFVQLAHHGGGNGEGVHNFYKLVNAPVVFHSYKGEEYPKYRGVNEIWAMENADLVIRTGNYGTVTLTLPFNVGDKFAHEREPVVEPYTKEYNKLNPKQ